MRKNIPHKVRVGVVFVEESEPGGGIAEVLRLSLCIEGVFGLLLIRRANGGGILA